MNEIANLEFDLSKVNSIRSSLGADEKVEFRYSLRHSNGQFSKQNTLTIRSINTNDSLSHETYD